MAFFCKRKLRFALIGTLALVGGGTFLSTCTTRPKAEPIPGVAETYTTTTREDPDGVVLNKCPVNRERFDAVRLTTPEIYMIDVLLCKGEVTMEADEGYYRRPVPVRVWKFPREGGGFLYIITTNYLVSGKRWE